MAADTEVVAGVEEADSQVPSMAQALVVVVMAFRVKPNEYYPKINNLFQ